ncbi:MAG: peptidoglycan-binding protein [Patescibacteria group bacterium]
MKKYIFGAVLSLGIIISPALTHAAGLTNSQVQAILSLLSSFGAEQSVINNVQASLTGSTSSSSSTAFCYNFNTDLTFGSTGPDISSLNQALSLDSQGELGRNNVFTENTAAAVVQFQAKYGIRQTGYVGPVTRARLNALYGCSNQTTSQTTPTISNIIAPAGESGAIYAGEKAFIYGTNLNNVLVNIGGRSIGTVAYGGTSLDFMVPSSLSAGTYNVSVANMLSGQNSNVYVVRVIVPTTPSATSPVITSVSPSTLPAGQTTFAINGSGFQSGATVSYSGNSAGNYNAIFSASFVSSSQLSVTGTGLAQGSSYMLVVKNPNGQTSTGCSTYTSCSSALSVGSGATVTIPTITVTSVVAIPQGQLVNVQFSNIPVGWNIRIIGVSGPAQSLPVTSTSLIPVSGPYTGNAVANYTLPYGGPNFAAITVPATASVGSYVVEVSDPSMGWATRLRTLPFYVGSSAQNSLITVTSPNGGGYWYRGRTESVTWSSINIPSNDQQVLIRLRSVDTNQEYNLLTSTVNDGAESLVVPTSIPLGSYRLEVKTLVGSYLDASDSYFTIVDPLVVTVPDITINGASGGFSPNPTVAFGGTFAFNWSVTPTSGTTCTAAGIGIDGGADAINLSGSWTTPALYTSTTYGVKCTNSLGTTYKYVNISVPAQTDTTVIGTTAPTITLNGNSSSSRLSINVAFGGTTTFNWGVTPTSGTSCSAAGTGVNGTTGSGAINLSGSWTTPALYANTTYGIACVNRNSAGVVSGTTYKYADVTVASQTSVATLPTAVLRAVNANSTTITSITSGQSVALQYESNSSCVASGGWSGTYGPGAGDKGPFYPTQTTTYTLTCTNPNGSAWQSVTVAVNAPVALPAPTISNFTPTSVVAGVNANIIVNGTNFRSGAVIVYSGTSSGELPAAWISAAGDQMSIGPYVYGAGNYTFRVRNTDGQMSGVSGTFTVSAPAAVTYTAPTLSVSNSSPTAGNTISFTWSATNGSNCYWSSNGTYGGSLTSSPVSVGTTGLSGTYNMTASCYYPNGQVLTSNQVPVTVSAPSITCGNINGLTNLTTTSWANYTFCSDTAAGVYPSSIVRPSTADGTGQYTWTCGTNSCSASISSVAMISGTSQTASALNALESASQTSSPVQGMTAGFSYTFTQDMYRGTQGSEVVALQRALHAEGLFAGEATGNFYDVTREAVIAFQIRYGINPTGYVGAETRAKLNALY